MKFGSVPLNEAAGAILAHSVAVVEGRLQKGLMLEACHLDQLRAAGIGEVTVARLEPGDLGEDAAAARLAGALAEGASGIVLGNPGTGRVNLIAEGPGIVRLNAAAIHAANAADPMITIATVPDLHQTRADGLIATVKIISYAVPEAAVEMACTAARGAVRLAAPRLRNASLIVTEIAGRVAKKDNGAISGRLEALGMTLDEELRVPHDSDAIARALVRAKGEMVLILTASATSDVNDTGPAGLRAAGGEVTRVGIPVDPGNLLFLGALGPRPVIGLPGCARAPALNGADWVLARIACGIEVGAEDIAAMGVGGLLKEIPSRPMPRRGKTSA
ncbi:molybdopterin-binding protein [Roseovarius sp. Pro17]|uniref:molybdopterin-binding protein n=1 Tax=Roseovarius sp. Pro17 TaxID=3108175 RepID=UPI002D78A794|nr:molybdopterin-binding protein [Roseovarius sp. Pro17]